MNMVKTKRVRPHITIKQIPLRGRATVSRRYVSKRTPLPSNPPAERCCSAAPPSACNFPIASDEEASTSKKQGTVEAWAKAREVLLGVRSELFCPSEDPPCTVCGVSLASGADIWRCSDCGNERFYCEGCISTVHEGSAVTHGLEKWEVCVLNIFLFNLANF